jgi:alpha-aminoadipate carrier protein LysW
MANCPECEALLEVDEDEVEEGDVISCSECGLDLEVVHQSPLEVERLDEEEEDDDAEAASYDEDDDNYDEKDDVDDDDDDDDDEEEEE